MNYKLEEEETLKEKLLHLSNIYSIDVCYNIVML